MTLLARRTRPAYPPLAIEIEAETVRAPLCDPEVYPRELLSESEERRRRATYRLWLYCWERRRPPAPVGAVEFRNDHGTACTCLVCVMARS